jgi:hypothetical protein
MIFKCNYSINRHSYIVKKYETRYNVIETIYILNFFNFFSIRNIINGGVK